MDYNKDDLERIKAAHPDLVQPDGRIDLESPTARKILDGWQVPKRFDKIGYARPLGGFFYEFFYGIIGIVLSVALFDLYLGVIYPWAESGGYASIAGVLFMLIRAAFNVPTEWGVDRFVAEWRVKNPKKMMGYLQWYIWYQMTTGLVLVTGFSWFIFMALNDASGLMYAKWLMLLVIVREYPAFGGIFISTLRGLQAYGKEASYNFITMYVSSKIIEIGFALWGQFYLGAFLPLGAIMGIAIGAGIGSIVSDLVSDVLGIVFLKGVLNKVGFSLKEMFTPRFDKEVIKTSLKFGFIVSIPGLFGAFFGTITTMWWYWGVPAFLTFTRLSGVADEFANIMKAGGGINIRGTLSEAYNSGMKALSSYYLAMQWKFYLIFAFALGSLIIAFMPFILTTLFAVGSASNYALAAAFVVPNLIATVAEEPIKTAENMLLGANKPHVDTLLRITADVLGLFLMYIALFVIKIPLMGTTYIIWLIPMLPFLPNLYRGIASWLYIGKKLCPVEWRKFGYQAIIAPIPPAILYGIVGNLWVTYVFPALMNAFTGVFGDAEIGMIVAAGISVLFAIFFGLYFFFPVYSFFGGWDDHTIAVFQEAVEISGPSRLFFMPIFKVSKFMTRISPLHGRFPIPHERAMGEATDLMRIRHVKDVLVKELRTA
jgi:hypothetical protein